MGGKSFNFLFFTSSPPTNTQHSPPSSHLIPSPDRLNPLLPSRFAPPPPSSAVSKSPKEPPLMADITVSLPQPALRTNFTSGYQFRPPATPEPNIWLTKTSTLSQEEEKERIDIWNSIQSEKQSTNSPSPPYIHPLFRRSSTLMSQKSLEICTESLGSETGSDGFSSGDEFDFFSSSDSETEKAVEEETEEEAGEETGEVKLEKKELPTVNYHCSIGRRSPARSFPPPLSSISRRDGPCLKMLPHRRDGRLVVEAIAVPSQTYLHAERHGGRLLLSFINSSSPSNPTPSIPLPQKEAQPEEEDEEAEEVDEEEEEVEVVDRGTIVEVKVSGLAAVKVHRSSLVINKFVVGSPLTAADVKVSAATTTAAAAAVAASSISAPASTSEGFHYNYLHHHQDTPWGPQSLAAAATADAKLLFASRRLRMEELLHDMRRCSELRRPLFIFEQPHCIATSS